jgi:potassium-transporting ATPase KdpC subunit
MNMSRYISKSILLLTVSVVILYLLSLPVIDKVIFSSQPNSSMLGGRDSRIVDSRQIAEPTPKDEYFQPRPSAAPFDALGSTSSAMAASNNFFHPQNRDLGVTEPPLLQRPTQTVCHFYDC